MAESSGIGGFGLMAPEDPQLQICTAGREFLEKATTASGLE